MTACPKMVPRITDKNHVGFSHQLVCVICGYPDVHYHHFMRGGTRRGQYRAGDNDGVPLCPRHHNIGKQSLHESGIDELTYFQMHGINAPYQLGADLYAHTGDYEACMAIIANAKSSEGETAPDQEHAGAASEAAPSDARRISAAPKPNPPVGE